MTKNQKLELLWIDKDQRLESRILLEGPRRSYHAKQRVMGATVGMYGDLQGIAGKSLQEIEGLEFSTLEPADATSAIPKIIAQ
jgi:hypothetical protein